MSEEALRGLPSIDQLLREERLGRFIDEAGRDTVRDRLREILGELRVEIRRGAGLTPLPTDAGSAVDEIARRLANRLGSRDRLRTKRVINAAGVVLHTNLGRAPLSPAALRAINDVAGGYCNLEYELETGRRGKRGSGLESMLRDLVGAGHAAVVNNCAAAVLLTLNSLAEGGEVIISRGELVEIGGSFRIPDVIAKSGARLREVGTTNRTRLSDYEGAINEQTRVILRAHPSNYRIVGFTEKPSLAELTALARAHHLPFFEDLGSGCLLDLSRIGLHDEPTVAASLAAGVSVVAFSGDKLLGGPQCGIILGEPDLIRKIRSNPLMRALRVDKLTYAALEATISSYLRGEAKTEVPAIAALHATREQIAARAGSLIERARPLPSTTTLELVEGASVVGGGSAPETELPTTLVAVHSSTLSPPVIEERLRNHAVPIIARIVNDRLTIDLRTVHPDEEQTVLEALRQLGD
ncbi:MAG: L-seryl-tRNA(Sec) selenium transferase [Acidobacteria bacterium]|nr:L-seryl-tRNA(Sec) selenium transferase [Acidobacteriota bacterium]